jgi:chemotaxis family two-component system response regulator Rcp1
MTRPAEILLVEDNDWDVRQMRTILGTLPFPTRIQSFRDPREFLAKLHEPRPAASPHGPDLIILDLNLPYMHGTEVLDVLKTDPVLKGVPVLILTTSEREQDRDEATRHPETFFATKPFLRADQPQVASLIEHLCRKSLDKAP